MRIKSEKNAPFSHCGKSFGNGVQGENHPELFVNNGAGSSCAVWKNGPREAVKISLTPRRRLLPPFFREAKEKKYFGFICYLVDPASNYMLVLKIKPCKCKYGPSIVGARLRTAH